MYRSTTEVHPAVNRRVVGSNPTDTAKIGVEIMANYRRGRETEYKCMEELENEGFITLRTAGSHGPIDVIAIRRREIKFIQLKRLKKDKKFHTPDSLIKFKRVLDFLDGDQISEVELVTITCELWIWLDHKGWKEKRII